MSAGGPNEIDAAGSVLFLGSGFSLEATNRLGKNVPSAEGLRRKFLEILEITDTDTDYDIRTLADFVNNKFPDRLYSLLRELFIVKDISNAQRKILSLPWRRIYTTNYDDVIEHYRQSCGQKSENYSCDNKMPRKIPKGAIVHIHGYIHHTTKDNIMDQLILGRRGYAEERFAESPWREELSRDMRSSTAVFFVGYGLNDHHITSLLLKEPDIVNKIYFIQPENVNEIQKYSLDRYGKVLPIGVQGFAKMCSSMHVTTSIGSAYNLKAFKIIEMAKDRKTLSKPTPVGIIEFLAKGHFHREYCMSTLPNSEYVVPRTKLVDEAANYLNNARCLLVHSRIANGKTVFLCILAHRLIEKGFYCFEYRPAYTISDNEFEYLDRLKGQIVVFIDSYDDAMTNIEEMTTRLPRAQFVITARTAVQEAQLRQIGQRFPNPIRRVNLDQMTEEDRKDFWDLVDHAGIGAVAGKKRAPGSRAVGRGDRYTEFREMILSLYDNDHIRGKIRQEVEPLIKHNKCRKVFTMLHILKLIGHDVEPVFLSKITSCDPYVEMAPFDYVAKDVFEMEGGVIRSRSAVLSEYLLGEYIDNREIIDGAYMIVSEGVKREVKRGYVHIVSNLMTFSFITRVLGEDQLKEELLGGFYEKLRQIEKINGKPLFWLQYAIFMTNADKLEAAKRFIDTAYERAEKIGNYNTFQIDTYAFKVMLLGEIAKESASHVENFDEIIDKLNVVRKIIADENRRFHAIQVLEEVEHFVLRRSAVLNSKERMSFIIHLNFVINDLNALPKDVRLYTKSDKIKASVERAIGVIRRD